MSLIVLETVWSHQLIQRLGLSYEEKKTCAQYCPHDISTSQTLKKNVKMPQKGWPEQQ